ncbi:hypothetical protein PG985_000287 [Apiospora marii]|uniref:Stc1 domain-containing protein n=1 Tax=Apiospora marii TaxID=335849 RepID=A0ABR1R298_9PEZI
MCRIFKCQVCGKVEHVENLHTPPCFRPTEVFRQCQACKNSMGDLKIDPKASSSTKAASDRPVPAKPPVAADQGKRPGLGLFKTLVAGRVRRRLTEVQKDKDQKREQAEAAATAMLKQQKQPQPQPPLSDAAAFGPEDMVLDDAEDNAELQQYLHDEPDEVRHYQTIMQQDDPDAMQLCIDMLESPEQKAEGPSAGKNLTLAEIVAMLPSPSGPPLFDYSKPAPLPDTSSLIDLGDSDDEDLKRYIGIGDDDDDDDDEYCIE